MEEGLIVDLQSPEKVLSSQPDEVVDPPRREIRFPGSAVELRALVSDWPVVFLPGAIEQRREPVVEQVEEIPEREVFLADPLEEEFAYGLRLIVAGLERLGG